MRVHVLRNPAGGGRKAQKRAAEIVGRLRGAGHEVIELTGESSDASSAALSAAVAKNEIEGIVVAGGDGLIHLAIQHLATTEIPVTIAPTGTGNDFATALGIEATTSIDLDAEATDLDLIEVTAPHRASTWVASIAIAGFPADINHRANALSWPIGSHIYAVAAVFELPTFTRRQVDVRLDNYPLSTDSAMLAIGNTKLFGGGMLACPDARPTDGLVHLTSIEEVGRIGLLPHLLGRAGGTADRPEVLRRACVQIDIDTPGIEFWADGEPLGLSPLSLRCVARALRVRGVHRAHESTSG